MDIVSSVETPVRVTTDRVKNPKRQEHMKKVNEKKKEIKLQMEKELESETPESRKLFSYTHSFGSHLWITICTPKICIYNINTCEK